MRAIFPDDLEKQFDTVFATAGLLCTKDELLAYNETPNRRGNPKRVCNASLLFCREYKRRIILRGTFFSAPGGARSIIRRAAREWKKLDPSEKYIFELAAQLMKLRFQRHHPTYKYLPMKKRPQQQTNEESDTQPNIINEEPATTTPSIPDEEPATAAAGGGEPAMLGRGLTGLPSPGTPLQLLPHTTIPKEQNATSQSLPHTTVATKQTEQTATSQSLPHTTLGFNISSMNSQYYYPSPQELIGSEASNTPSDEYLSTPFMTPDSTAYSDPGTPDTVPGAQMFPNISDIEASGQEVTIIPINEIIQESISEESRIEVSGIEEPNIEIEELVYTIEGEFDRLFGTGHYDYLEYMDEPCF